MVEAKYNNGVAGRMTIAMESANIRSVRRLAKISQVPMNYIYRVLKGTINHPEKHAVALAKGLGVDTTWLMYGVGSAQTQPDQVMATPHTLNVMFVSQDEEKPAQLSVEGVRIEDIEDRKQSYDFVYISEQSGFFPAETLLVVEKQRHPGPGLILCKRQSEIGHSEYLATTRELDWEMRFNLPEGATEVGRIRHMIKTKVFKVRFIHL